MISDAAAPGPVATPSATGRLRFQRLDDALFRGTARAFALGVTGLRLAVLTGVLLAVARIAGATAPPLFTALTNQFWTANLNGPMANLPAVSFQFAMSPSADWPLLAGGGALLIAFAILVRNVVARWVASRSIVSQ
ncbi:MAG TPA: hypothetical protein VMU87_08955 [Stellaceae bacterium]|nr:hypothetical protein [Stellaceae bacterium]